MAYRVSLTALAETDVYSAFEYIRTLAPLKADQWLDRLFEAIFSLEQFPTRCQVIPESEELGYPVRHLLFGRASSSYRIISKCWRRSGMCAYYASGTARATPSMAMTSGSRGSPGHRQARRWS